MTYPLSLDVVGVEVSSLDELLGLRADGVDALGVRAHVSFEQRVLLLKVLHACQVLRRNGILIYVLSGV